jgi:Rrf2 family protein
MMLTKMTRFGTRAVFDIAYNSSGSPVQVRDIAKRQEIPLRFLEQIFHKLKKADFIKGERGPSGGYVLTKDPSEITVGDIVRAVDESLDVVCCVSDTKPCHRADQCVTRPIWQEASRKIKDYLDTVTIADLCEDACKKGIKQDLNHPFDYNI